MQVEGKKSREGTELTGVRAEESRAECVEKAGAGKQNKESSFERRTEEGRSDAE